MRCKYCGSNMIHPETQHKTFSTGKAVAGTVAFGVVGAAAGLIGKDQKGYKCGACGAFMDAPMDFATESGINSAVRDAECGRDRTMFDYFKSQYANIQANIPAPAAGAVAVTAYSQPAALPVSLQAQTSEVKNSYKYTNWLPDCPVYIETIIVKTSEYGDVLSLYAQNQSKQSIRSAYFKASVYDDTGDRIHEVSCVYQSLDLAPGDYLPVDKEFKLNTEVAYKVELICEKVALSDDSVWRYNPEAKSFKILPQPAMTADTFPRLKYVRAQLKNYGSLDENADLFIPCEGDGFWQCLCGHPALQGKPCPRCHAGYEKLQELISQKNLSAIQQEQVKARATARAEKTIPLYEKAAELAAEKMKKAEADRIAAEEAEKKRVEDSYQAAAAQMASAGDIAAYTQAMEALKALNGYKDSEELAAKCQAEINRLSEEQRIATENAAQKRKKIIMITALVVAACIAFVILLTSVIIPNGKYNSAVALMNEGEYEEAIVAFEELNGYRDSESLIEQMQAEDEISKIVGASVGDTITFGLYPQDKNYNDKPIEWEILEKQEGRVLVVSKYVLFCAEYNEKEVETTWETCSLRKKLNEDFLASAFTEAEQAFIPTVTVTADDNPEYNTSAGNDTQDKLFLLSVKEVQKYMEEEAAASVSCEPTEWVNTMWASLEDGYSSCCWWTRTPGKDSTHAVQIGTVGAIIEKGMTVRYGGYGVRPALWINLAS